jgi:transcriptional regulator with PAS, ATPase and Fis domain
MPGSSSAPAPARSQSEKPQNAVSSPPSSGGGDPGEEGRNTGQLQDATFIFTTDLAGVITSCNQNVDRYGYAPKGLVGRSLGDFYNAGQSKSFVSDAIASVLREGRLEVGLRCRTESGPEVDVRLCLTLLRNSNAEPTSILGFSVESNEEGEGEKLSPQKTPSAPLPLARREIDGTEFLIASPIMHKFMGMVDRVAGHTETVLVTGETGTGKELVARTIHGSSYRHKKALIDINCAALPEHLVESELFGYEKGAFSGADSSKPGLFELADKSTIFLDEIGELQPQIQVKLLRVLDGAPYYRLGGNRKITVDVRVVAATNQDLELAVKEGRFRKDLFHRLGQFQLRVPPLRERPEDIAVLARHFLSLKAANKDIHARRGG